MKGLVEFFELGVGHADGDVLEVDEKGDFAFVHAASRWLRSDVPVVLGRIVFEVWLAAHPWCSGRLTPNGAGKCHRRVGATSRRRNAKHHYTSHPVKHYTALARPFTLLPSRLGSIAG